MNRQGPDQPRPKRRMAQSNWANGHASAFQRTRLHMQPSYVFSEVFKFGPLGLFEHERFHPIRNLNAREILWAIAAIALSESGTNPPAVCPLPRTGVSSIPSPFLRSADSGKISCLSSKFGNAACPRRCRNCSQWSQAYPLLTRLAEEIVFAIGPAMPSQVSSAQLVSETLNPAMTMPLVYASGTRGRGHPDRPPRQ